MLDDDNSLIVPGDEEGDIFENDEPDSETLNFGKANDGIFRILENANDDSIYEDGAEKQEYVVTATTLLNMGVEEIPTLLDPILQKIGIAAIIGSSDTGKSSFLRQLAYEVANGSPSFLGFKVNSTRQSAIYVSTEDDEVALGVLLRKQFGERGISPSTDRLKFIFQTEDLLTRLEKEMTNHPVDLVVIDAFADVYTGNMNQINEVRGYLYKYADLARRHQCLIIFLHHTGKRTDSLIPRKDNAIGSQGFEGRMRLVIEFRKDPQIDDVRHLCLVKGNYISQEYKKQSIAIRFNQNLTFENLNYGVPFEKLAKEYSRDDSKFQAKSRANDLKKQGLSVRQITEALKKEGFEVSKSAVGEWIKGA